MCAKGKRRRRSKSRACYCALCATRNQIDKLFAIRSRGTTHIFIELISYFLFHIITRSSSIDSSISHQKSRKSYTHRSHVIMCKRKRRNGIFMGNSILSHGAASTTYSYSFFSLFVSLKLEKSELLLLCHSNRRRRRRYASLFCHKHTHIALARKQQSLFRYFLPRHKNIIPFIIIIFSFDGKMKIKKERDSMIHACTPDAHIPSQRRAMWSWCVTRWNYGRMWCARCAYGSCKWDFLLFAIKMREQQKKWSP